jgi:hypothetical protein
VQSLLALSIGSLYWLSLLALLRLTEPPLSSVISWVTLSPVLCPQVLGLETGYLRLRITNARVICEDGEVHFYLTCTVTSVLSGFVVVHVFLLH